MQWDVQHFKKREKTVGWLVVSDREAMGALGVNGF